MNLDDTISSRQLSSLDKRGVKTMWSPRILIGLLGAFILSLIAWSSVTPIELSTNAPGTVVPAGNLRTIQNLEGGIVSDIFVAEGQGISAGQKLIEFEAIASQSEVGEIEAHIAFLTVEMLLIDAQLSGQS